MLTVKRAYKSSIIGIYFNGWRMSLRDDKVKGKQKWKVLWKERNEIVKRLLNGVIKWMITINL